MHHIQSGDLSRRTIDTLIEAFRVHAAALCAEMEDPELAQDMCHYVSAAFSQWLAAGGVDSDVVVCEGSKIDFPNHSWDHKVDFSEYWHVVVEVGGWHVDWTRKQFDRDAAVPHVCTRDEALAHWGLVEEIGQYEQAERDADLEYEAAA